MRLSLLQTIVLTHFKLNNMEAISVINLMPSGKESLDFFIKKVVNEVKCGNENPLSLAVKLKYIELSLDAIREGIQDEMLKEHSKHGAKSIDLFGFKIEQAEVGVKYDFSNCGDEWLVAYEEEAKILDEKIKKRKEYLKAIQGHEQLVDGEGVVTVVTPPIKSSKTSLKFTLKR